MSYDKTPRHQLTYLEKFADRVEYLVSKNKYHSYINMDTYPPYTTHFILRKRRKEKSKYILDDIF